MTRFDGTQMPEGRLPPPACDELQFFLDRSHECVVAFDRSAACVYRNEKARQFLQRHALPAEVPALSRKIHGAIARGESAVAFPGRIAFSKSIGARKWRFRVAFRGGARPLVCCFFYDEVSACGIDLNALREGYRLTRREVDVLWHLLEGRKNREIAGELAIVEQTVKDYLSNIYHKIGVPNRFALLRRLVNAPQP